MTSASVVHVAEHISNDEAVALSLDTLRQQALQDGGLQRSTSTDEELPSRREAWLSLLDLSHLSACLSEPAQAEAAPLDTDEALARHLAALEMNSNAPNGDAEETEWQTAHSKRSKRRARSEASEGLLDLPNGSNGSSLVAASRNGADSATSSASVNGGAAPSELNEAGGGGAPSQGKKKNKKKKSAARQATLAELAATPHKDESQVELDVKRSFVGDAWAQIVDQQQRPLRRRQLTSIITRVLRAHSALSYYQGYHDVIAVLLVCLSPTLPDVDAAEEALWSSEEEGDMIAQAAARLSLHWLRDFMTSDLEPALGALKLIRNLLRRADAEVAEVVELASPLPYFALSWFISLFCHDLEPELSIRAMDWFLVEGPSAAIYVVVALVLSDRTALLQLADEPDIDPAEIHHHLSQLPSSITTSSLEGLLTRASELSASHALESSSSGSEGKRKVMGASSVLTTFAHLQRRAKVAAWKARDVHAESILRGPVERIVVDPTPTPPAFDDVEESQDGLYKAPEKLRISKRDGKNGGGNAVLVAGAVGAAAAILLFAASGGRLPPQTIEMLKNMALRSR